MNPEITKIIEHYLNDELSPADKAEFEKKLSENQLLRDEVALQKSIHEAAKRAARRTIIKRTGRKYHFKKNLVTASIIAVIVAASAIATYVTVKQSGSQSKGMPAEVLNALLDELDKLVPMDNIAAEYFELSKADTVVLSRSGVLLSVPEGAFLLNGKPFKGGKVLQWQEALDAATIVKGGLSTMSGNKLLETQGMFGLQAFTTEGEKLDVNPAVGVYVQLPVDELKEGMQLFEGKPKANGAIDWQNPKPLEKKPVIADMEDLDFYPSGYEKELDKLKWKTGKKSRDSLYLSLEESSESVIIIDEYEYAVSDLKSDYRNFIEGSGLPSFVSGKKLFEQKCATCHTPHKDGTGPKLSGVRQKWISEGAKEGSIYRWVNNWNSSISYDSYCLKVAHIQPTNMKTFPELTVKEIDAIFDYADGIPDDRYIPPSSVLAFWNPKFNNTILSTRDFEKRMASVHKTCDKEVLKMYTGNLNKPLFEIDERVAEMGYPEFGKFAVERVGAVTIGDPHMKSLKEFYEQTIAQLKTKVKEDKDFIRKLEAAQDSEMNRSRSEESERRIGRNTQNYSEEFNLNYNDCLRQLGKTGPVVGFTIRGGTSVYNLDKFVAEMTASRASGSFYDKETGKTARIQYNPFSLSVDKPEQYEKLFLYLFPHELNSFQRIDPKSTGLFDYPLNTIIRYDLAVVGINENGYYLFTKEKLTGGKPGTISLANLSEREFNIQIERLNKARNASSVKIFDELSWLKDEKANYKVQRLRKEMAAFRNSLKTIVFPCISGTEYSPPVEDDIEGGGPATPHI